MVHQKVRRKQQLIRTENDLKQSALTRDHDRQQRLKDAVNTMILGAVYVVPAAFLLGGLVYGIHLVRIGNWDEFRSIIYNLAAALGGYVVAELKNNGIQG